MSAYGYGNQANIPAGVKSQDGTGEQMGRKIGGVGAGMRDSNKADGFGGGKSSTAVAYTHQRKPHDQRSK